jgi:hypothetical protein
MRSSSIAWHDHLFEIEHRLAMPASAPLAVSVATCWFARSQRRMKSRPC